MNRNKIEKDVERYIESARAVVETDDNFKRDNPDMTIKEYALDTIDLDIEKAELTGQIEWKNELKKVRKIIKLKYSVADCLCDIDDEDDNYVKPVKEWVRSTRLVLMPYKDSRDRVVFGFIKPKGTRHAVKTKFLDGASGEPLYAVECAYQGWRYEHGIIYEPKK